MTSDPRLRNLFVEGLRLVHAAHHQGAAQAEANIGSSSLPALKRFLKSGSDLNLAQARRLEPIFRMLGRDVEDRTDRAMKGIVEANRDLVAKADGRVTRDLANIGSGQVAAHFFIATYATLRAYAHTLGAKEALPVFDRALGEIRRVDRDLTALAARVQAHAGDPAYPSESALRTAAALHPVRTAAAGFALVATGAAALIALAPPPRQARRGFRRLRSR